MYLTEKINSQVSQPNTEQSWLTGRPGLKHTLLYRLFSIYSKLPILLRSQGFALILMIPFSSLSLASLLTLWKCNAKLVECPSNLHLDCARKAEHLEETHADMRRRNKLKHSETMQLTGGRHCHITARWQTFSWKCRPQTVTGKNT